MEIKQARFLVSNSDPVRCPRPDKPEYAFIGRSNVGKSSLINMLTNSKSLAKTSEKPGKTRLINHFLINEEWYLVDLPGYGYAKVPLTERRKWESSFRQYILGRTNLCCLFILIDIRHAPLETDLQFLEWVGESQVPFAVVFTKSDKLKPVEVDPAVAQYREALAERFEPLPPVFVTSSASGSGKEGILGFIGQVNKTCK
ncbi:MAG: YihA family ribosome biogenesis GTP-binding protein [Prolixibacteraceae bacterium]|jgi:GTP-binding protein|nr:YihA family ribosome biogenesis GTP-binding protein [Prolixibacteraceae bacterium]NLX27600.1 YihA family ribosome biogenesis GTP-binding protein [Bacteroidales bacterium]HRV88815.1 ribosome biogenesis GTP-binding protein YihA/YsxC [Prolixibacteraceae bacterium]